MATFPLVALTHPPTGVCSHRSSSECNSNFFSLTNIIFFFLKKKKKLLETPWTFAYLSDGASTEIHIFSKLQTAVQYHRASGGAPPWKLWFYFSSDLRLRSPFHVCRFYVAVAILHRVLSRRKASVYICPMEESSVLLDFLLHCSWASCHFINE